MLLALAIVGLFVLPDPWRILALGTAAIIEVGEVYLWIRFLRRYRVTTGAEGLIGEWAVVIERCDPRGRVRVRGEIWNARAEGADGGEHGAPAALEVGEEVRIRAVEGLTLVVRPDADRGDGWGVIGDPAGSAGSSAEHGKGPRRGAL